MADMMDIDNILEDDLIDALGELGVTKAPKSEVAVDSPSIEEIDDITIDAEPATEQNINISSSSSNIDDIATLLKELLNNKTIEITIKIKDN